MTSQTHIGWHTTMPDANIHPHPQHYQGLPYLATITIGKQVHTAVVDFVLDGDVHYYHIDNLGIANCSAFLIAVEQYHNSGASKQVPLSVFISSHNYGHVCSAGYRCAPLEDVKVVGFCPTHWFPTIKVKWRRLDLTTGAMTRSKTRRPADVIAAEKARKAANRAKRNLPPKDDNATNSCK